MAEVAAMFAVGAAVGGLIVFAWMSDLPRYARLDPADETENGVGRII